MTTLSVPVYQTLDTLPASYPSLFATADSFYLSRPWFRTLTATTADDGDRLRIYGVETGGEAEAALIARVPRRTIRQGGIRQGGVERIGPIALRTLAGFTTVYSPLFSLVRRPGADEAAIARALAAALADERWDCIHLKALEPAAPEFVALHQALREQGRIVQPYLGFGNWFETTAGTSFDAYLARRPAALINTLRRKEKKLGKQAGLRFRRYRDPAEADEGIAAYQRVYANSWKQPEPYPQFMPALIRTAADLGALRLGVVWIGEEPVAAQVWVTWRGRATIFKLAHDRRCDALSVGSVLTMWMMRDALEEDRVGEVDFGVGDDPYKRIWLSQRRERWGLLALSPQTARGLLGIVRHLGGRAIRQALCRSAKPQPTFS